MCIRDRPAGVPKADLLVSVWGGPHADLQKSVVSGYPNGTVTIDDVDYGNLQSKQVTSFAAQPGTGNYDVVWIDSNWLQQYVKAGYIQPIDDYIAKSGRDTSIYAGGRREDCKVDGKLYGLPTFAQCLILCYCLLYTPYPPYCKAEAFAGQGNIFAKIDFSC